MGKTLKDRKKDAEERDALRQQRSDIQQLEKIERDGHYPSREAKRLREKIALSK